MVSMTDVFFYNIFIYSFCCFTAFIIVFGEGIHL